MHRLEGRGLRVATVVAAPAAALIAWRVTQLIGVDLKTSNGSIGAGSVLVVSLLVALIAWPVANLIGRRSGAPRRRWVQVTIALLVISLAGPASAKSAGAAACLICLHLIVAAVVITGYAQTLPRRSAPG